MNSAASASMVWVAAGGIKSIKAPPARKGNQRTKEFEAGRHDFEERRLGLQRLVVQDGLGEVVHEKELGVGDGAAVDVDEETVPRPALDVALAKGRRGQVGGAMAEGFDKEIWRRQVACELHSCLGFRVGDILLG